MNNKLGVCSVIAVAALMGVGCAKGVNFGSNALSSNGSEGVPVVNSVPACEINIPQLLLNANVDSFEFQDSNGFSFGYNPTGLAGGLGGSINDQITTASMSLSMEGDSPLGLNQEVLADTVSSSQTTTNLNVGINFSGFGVGANTYSSTPLAAVSLNGLNLGVQGIKSQYDAEAGWIGRVIQFANANTVILNGGTATGILQGDTFNVYNVSHFWQDNTQPCAPGNAYLGSTPTPVTPVAVLTVQSVDSSTNTAFATFVLTGATTINLGAEVHPLTLVAPPKGAAARYLKKNVVVGTIGAKSFALPGGGTFDFGTAVNGQFRSSVNANGFYVQN